MDTSLGKPWEIVKDREGWCAAVHRAAKSQTQLGNWTTIPPKQRKWGERPLLLTNNLLDLWTRSATIHFKSLTRQDCEEGGGEIRDAWKGGVWTPTAVLTPHLSSVLYWIQKLFWVHKNLTNAAMLDRNILLWRWWLQGQCDCHSKIRTLLISEGEYLVFLGLLLSPVTVLVISS